MRNARARDEAASDEAPLNQTKVCQEKGRLLLRYSDCIGAYHQAVKTLTSLHPTSPPQVNQELMDRVEQTRLDCEEAHLAFQRHVLGHKC